MKTITELERDIEMIKERNSTVEINKAWETSITRKILIIFFTYLTIGFYFIAIGVKNPWINSVVPALGFMLSTLSLPFFKKIWQKYMYKSR